jgi:glutamate/tyrosine decarboxylase-like PLP-dependent enzyme
MNKANSWATDAHKLLNVPYDSGIALVNDGAALHGAMSITAEYLPFGDTERNPGEFTPELSRRARGVEVWAALKSLGREGLEKMVQGSCEHARRFAEGLDVAGYEILNEVVYNQVLVSFGDAKMTDRVIAAIQEDGTCWCGGTVWRGRTAMRISVCSWATTRQDVELSLEAMLSCAAKVMKK